eukprot:Lithocolla_globosa_v1_NODE_7787_length_900_cov_13.649704.p1 type:complete len:212 gc:universal NODE_7787_length_900_cov_13.649704:123-758(+)
MQAKQAHKVLLIGDVGTGKTSLMKRYCHNIFTDTYKATIGVDFGPKQLSFGEDWLNMHLWDIAGQERFGNMSRVYYKEATGAFVVVDCTRASTIDGALKWKKDVDSKVVLNNGNPIPVVLLINKCDLVEEFHEEKKRQIDLFCEKNGFDGWFLTSAKENIGMDEGGRFLAEKLLKIELPPVYLFEKKLELGGSKPPKNGLLPHIISVNCAC